MYNPIQALDKKWACNKEFANVEEIGANKEKVVLFIETTQNVA